MSGEQSTGHGPQRTKRESIHSGPIVEQAPLLISSTSLYLQAKINLNSTKDPNTLESTVDVESLIATITLEMRTALVIPCSKFTSAEHLVKEYGEAYLAGLEPDDRLKVAQAYMEGLQAAKQEGRYFGRNIIELKENFGMNEEAAVNAFLNFMTEFGYKYEDGDHLTYDGQVKPEYSPELFQKLCLYFQPGKYLVHRSEAPDFCAE